MVLMKPSPTFFPTSLGYGDIARIEKIAAAIGVLNGAVFRGFGHESWYMRACWMGYARALQLQAIELDEIDVISWGCAVPIPGRARHDTLVDPFGAFREWQVSLGLAGGRHWREDLPFSPTLPPAFSEAPIVLRAIAIVCQYAAARPHIQAWLSLPILLHRMGITAAPLPCLVAGDKGARFGTRDPDAVVSRVLRDLAHSATDAVAMLAQIEADRRRWIEVLAAERKPGALRDLAALTMRQPLFRPEPLARQLGLSLSGAGKLLERAAALGFVTEISGRGSWRVYMIPDMARRLGLAPMLRGRPAKPPPLPKRDPLGAQLAAFDAEMAALAARFPHLKLGEASDGEPGGSAT
ncbi:hypothetical protein [Sphingomonas crocodyli]|uniref:Uncharacterized protein n=1 Tax=Sphingomonas crocodyli TaxID=1979270 RepID=A0A437LY64_9SPHN|nr:hypothetical protein [Sphingomonas crocodyli]RVT90322.1 hypothetical protein EOD43_18810 [Sphingomonas crocodyli]